MKALSFLLGIDFISIKLIEEKDIGEEKEEILDYIMDAIAYNYEPCRCYFHVNVASILKQ